MAGKALFRRLAAARRHGEVPGDSAGFQARIDNALTMLRQDDADAAPGDRITQRAPYGRGGVVPMRFTLSIPRSACRPSRREAPTSRATATSDSTAS
jgi:hypothetical protein